MKNKIYFLFAVILTCMCIACTNNEEAKKPEESTPCTNNEENEEADDTLYRLTLTIDTSKASFVAGLDTSVNGSYTKGTKIQLPPFREFPEYRFEKWTSTDGGCFSNANNTTYFTMPAHDTTIEPMFR